MSAPDFSLLAKRRFGPMFVVQFIGAFNDNALKYAMLFLVTFTLYKGDENGAASLAALTIYDMCKAIDKGIRIDGVRLLEKRGGTSGEYRAG